MATYAKILNDASGNQILPYSRAKLIYMDDNSTVETAINNIQNQGGYTLPAATKSTLGGVKIGSNISVENGTISVPEANETSAGHTMGVVSVYDTYGNASSGASGSAAFGIKGAYRLYKEVKLSDNYNNIATREASSINCNHHNSYGADHCIIAGEHHPLQYTTQTSGSIILKYFDPWVADGALVGGYYSKSVSSGVLLGLGNGTSSASSTCFYVNKTGNVYASGKVTAAGADYAEYFEWYDGNIDNEDRRGLFVTLDGDKIKLASKDNNYILGIISGNPTVIGDGQDAQWKYQYERDIFGTIKHSEETENHLVLNPDYDPDKEYIPRSERPEWDPVGLMGKLICIDDGTCEVNGYCYPSENGIGTKSDHGYRVMKRIDDTHIQVLVR